MSLINTGSRIVAIGLTAWACTAGADPAVSGVVNPGVTLNGVETTAPRAVRKDEPRFSMPTRPPMNAPVGSLKLQLDRFELSGNTVFSTQSLNHLLGDVVGGRVSFADLLRAANRVTNFYRDAGYLVARAYVPEQEIQGGVVEIVILEGLVGDVDVKNLSDVSPGLVASYTDRVRSGTVVSRKNVERAMLLLNDLPGVQAKATFKVGEEEGTTDLDVDISQTSKYSGSLDVNNFGSEFTGEARLGASFYVNQLLGRGDALGLRVLTSEQSDTLYGNLSYSVAAGGNGTRVGFTYSNLAADVGDEFAILDLESEADTWGVFVAHPFTRSRDANVVGQFGLERRHVQQSFGGPLSESDSEDKVLVLTLGATADYRDTALGGGVSTVGIAIQTGIDRLGSLEPSRVGAKGSFVKLGMSYSRLQYLTAKTSALFRVSGQFSEDALISSEQFSLGGPAGVRSFISGEGLADTGFVASAELRHRLGLSNRFLKDLQIIGFVDFGQGHVNSSLTIPETNFDVAGAGIGIKLGTIGDYQIDLSYAHSLTGRGETEDAEDGKVLFQAIKWFD